MSQRIPFCTALIVLVTTLFAIVLFSSFSSKETVLETSAHRSLSDTQLVEKSADGTPPCDHPIWCQVPMPAQSLFRFPDAPNDPVRWAKAQRLAAAGEPALLRHIVPHFPHYFDFLDGEIFMRPTHGIADYFIDNNFGFEVLNKLHPGYSKNALPMQNVFGKKKHVYKWEQSSEPTVIPEPYNIKALKRAPVMHVGYFAFDRKGSSSASMYFEGFQFGEASIDRHNFLRIWNHGKKTIDRPWIGLHSANENWGLFSTYFPNRTVDWGRCCGTHKKDDRLLYEMLDHPKTLMFLTNQHHNLTHPKLISLPRGLPIHGDHSRRIIFDRMQMAVRNASKEQLLYTASSNWGYRPNILACLAKKFDPQEAKFKLHHEKSLSGRITSREYYRRISNARFSIALSGLGYDTYRVWESLTLGTIPILEKGIGLDKTLWRLPALLVEDFDLVTPELLRTAYVEAMYRAAEFEFQRLTQKFWWNFILNVSRTMSTESVLQYFPLESEDPTFARPFVRFSCHQTKSCSRDTKRIPPSFC